jgi:hypothetical protein
MEALFEGGVLGGTPDGVFGVLGSGVAELAGQLADAGALSADLGVRGFECLLGIERPLLPGRLCQDASAWASRAAASWSRWSSARVVAAVTRRRAAALS